MRRTLTIVVAVVCVGLVAADTCLADLTNGLVTYYSFSGDATDQSSSGNDGTVHGAVLTSDRFGNADSAYYFDGVNDYISASASGLPTAERTVSVWFYTDIVTNRPNLVGYGGGPVGSSWLMGINHWGHAAMGMTSHNNYNTIEYYYGPGGEPVGAWYHFVITTDSTGTHIYLNGDLKKSNGTFVQNTYVSGKDLAIGVAVTVSGFAPYADSNVKYFRGVIDDVGIWNRALSAAEIEQLMDNGLSCVPVPGAALLGAMGLTFTGWRLKRKAA